MVIPQLMKTCSIYIFFLLHGNLYAMKPMREYVGTPDQYGLKYAEQNVKTPDGYNIKVWDIEPTQKNDKYAHFSVVLCGADAGNMSYFLAPAIALSNEGIHVVMFDYRGYGKSADFAIDSTLLFHQEFLIDFEEVLAYTKNKYPKNKVGTLGFSMGGYFPLITKQKLDFIITDSPMLNPERVVEVYKIKKINLPPKSQTAKFGDTPTLLFLANQDKVLKFNEIVEDNTENINTSKILIVPYNGKHIEGIYVNAEFTPHILRFLVGLT